MVYGFVLLSTKNSYEHNVAEKLSLLEEVVDVKQLLVDETALADPFFEEYNLIAKIKIDSPKQLREIIENKIHKINGVEKIKIASKPKL
jgi:DNA-binding Lrp family transcriptional regulator